MHTSLISYLDGWATATPHRTAIVEGDSLLSYAELSEQSEAFAKRLIAGGTTAGELVGLCMPRGIDATVALLGILRAKACYVPIDPFAPAHRAEAIARACQMKVLVTDSLRAKSIALQLDQESDKTLSVCVIGDEALGPEVAAGLSIFTTKDRAEVLPLPFLCDTDLAYILHTSGSTGVPKGVVFSHRNAMTFVEAACARWTFNQSDCFSHQAPLHFDLSVFDLFCAFRVGAKVVVVPEFYSAFPAKMIALIRKEKISVWNSVVATLRLWNTRGKLDQGEPLDSLRAVLFSGEAMPRSLLRSLSPHLPKAKLFNVYGQTEANSSLCYEVTAEDLSAGENGPLPMGYPLPNFDVFALDEKGKAISKAAVSGELYVRSHSVALGYYQDSEKSATRFVSDPRRPESLTRCYRTGDRVQLDSEGRWLFQGRSDHMIKIRGYRVELGEIESHLHDLPAVESACVLALETPEDETQLIAFVAVAKAEISDSEILASLRQRLPKYMVPSAVHLLDAIPRTSTEKIDRQVLLALAHEKHPT